MPPWVPAEKVAACETTDNSRQRRPTLGGGMPAWGPASAPRPLDSSCVSLESKPGESSDVPAESETPVKLIESTVPTWLAAAAAGGTEASDQVREGLIAGVVCRSIYSRLGSGTLRCWIYFLLSTCS